MSEWLQWPRRQQTILYLAGLLDELRDRGFITGGNCRTTESGAATYRDMKRLNWRPSDDELARAFASMCEAPLGEKQHLALRLVQQEAGKTYQ